MGFRSLYRGIARARLKEARVIRVNKKMARKDSKGERLWEAAAFGSLAGALSDFQTRPRDKDRRDADKLPRTLKKLKNERRNDNVRARKTQNGRGYGLLRGMRRGAPA